MVKYKQTTEDKVIDSIVIIFSVFILIATLYPFYLVLIYSFNEGKDAMKGHLYFLPRAFTLNNYKVVFSDNDLGISFIVTVLRTLIGTITAVFFTAMVAYGLSKERLIFRKFYSITCLITMYFGGGLIPSYLLLRNLNLLNKFWVYIIPGLFAYNNALLFMAFFRQMPVGLEDSAKIDGAGDFYIFIKIILPLSKPILATIALFVGVGHWNDWFASAYYINNQKLWTMPTILMKVLSGVEGMNKINEIKGSMSGMDMCKQNGTNTFTLESIKYATLVVTIFPITIIYPFLQRYFVKGMMIGAIKA